MRRSQPVVIEMDYNLSRLVANMHTHVLTKYFHDARSRARAAVTYAVNNE
jgi:hypothetical protein